MAIRGVIMKEDNYICEAVYFLSKTPFFGNTFKYDFDAPNELEMRENVFKAMLRILISNNLALFENNEVFYSEINKKDLESILDFIKENPCLLTQCEEFYEKATSDRGYFFDEFSDIEYEIYSRVNYEYSYQIGEQLGNHIDFNNSKVLDAGGNSGGLATAIANKFSSSNIIVADTIIPINVGREFQKTNNLNNVDLVVADIFDLNLEKAPFDYIILSNILHDFDDQECIKILKACKRNADETTSLLIVEDILETEFEPKEVIAHGLRLATEVKNGQQRTETEMGKLLEKTGFESNFIQISDVHKLAIANKVKGRR